MPFKNQRNSRDDNSRKQRSNSENFKSKGGPGRKSTNTRSESFGKSSFSKDNREEKSSFGKSNFGKNRSEESRSFNKGSFSRNRAEEGGSFNKGSFSRNRSEEGGSFNKSSFSRNRSEDSRSFNKGSFSRNRSEEGGSSNKGSFSRNRSESDRSFNKPSFSKDRFEDRKSGGRPSKFNKPSSSTFDRSKDGDARENRSFGSGRKRIFNDEYQEQKDNNDFKYSDKHKFKPARKPANHEVEDDGLIRLNRYISNSGICSRRKADELISAGVISVNGEVVTELGTKVDPAKDEIRYNNERLKREKMVYVLLNKPKDYITTTDDPQERRTVMELVSKATKERIYPVGRLDRNTTGLLLMTNDGNLADKLSHPKNNITKIYQIELNKSLTQGDFNKIEFGLELEDGFIKPDDLSYVQGASKREIGIQIHSGKNRIVRRIFESLGYEVIKLDRVVYAGLTKKDLPRGRWRYLEERELIQLKHLIK
ncbi:pseudouridine synthase [Sphingobacterium yanglingense]|uniref:Pseudouridine synthase n=1 Tax=Sphingobacterium yanglingense TaxID=1437280 RepID=A0A4R6WT18_9SPHI|nr:pseudouridine synthase [Sphingobacterium yanglingense]TDQ82783.1 23S rRNA pseudouridine2605 synthase [Sphingobacterium yanglingense]